MNDKKYFCKASKPPLAALPTPPMDLGFKSHPKDPD